jgi:hypothetical protein
MLKKLVVSSLIFGSVLAFAQPRVSPVQDRDNHNYSQSRDNSRFQNNYRNERRPEFRERERFVQPSFRRVVGDRRFGYYDRFHHWCWY